MPSKPDILKQPTCLEIKQQHATVGDWTLQPEKSLALNEKSENTLTKYFILIPNQDAFGLQILISDLSGEPADPSYTH